MNHILGVPLEQKQFVEIRKVSGLKRSGSKFISISFFKKYFDGVSVDAYVYFTKLGKEKYMITKKPYSERSYEKRVLSGGSKTLKLYLDEEDLLLGGYYSFYTCRDGLILQKSTLKEIEMRTKTKRTTKSGLVISNQTHISIQKKDIPFFRGEHGYHVDVYQGSRLYMKITQIPKEQVREDKNISLLSRSFKESEMFEYEAVDLVPVRQLYIPRTFLKKAKMERGDHFTLRKMNSYTMLVIPKKQKDEITQEYFDPFETGRKEITINKTERDGVKSMQRIKENSKLDLAAMLQEMRKINHDFI